MSTEFYTEPPIEYAVFLAACPVTVEDPFEPKYILPHKRMRLGTVCIWVCENERGEATFERFGRNNPTEIFTNIIRHFGVRIFDEYTLEWPKESGG